MPSSYTYTPPAHALLQCTLTGAALGLAGGLVLPRAKDVLVADEPGLLGPRLACFGLALVIFHLLEFIVTAVYAPSRVNPDSFLLRNGEAYWYAMGTGTAEWLLESYFGCVTLPHWTLYLGKLPCPLAFFLQSLGSCTEIVCVCVCAGLALILFGQTLRSLAMVHAAENFSHIVATSKRDDHKLVTTGVYGYSRHPSYVGFFYWALGTQVLLFNPVSFVVFAAVLGQFFSSRIKYEEVHLRQFFPDYEAYARRVPTLLGFV